MTDSQNQELYFGYRDSVTGIRFSRQTINNRKRWKKLKNFARNPTKKGCMHNIYSPVFLFNQIPVSGQPKNRKVITGKLHTPHFV